MAETEEELMSILMNMKKESEKVGLKLYISQSHQEKKGEELNQQNKK